MALTRIDSLQNPRVKLIKELIQKRHRDRSGLFLLEGERELARGLKSGLDATQILICEELFKHQKASETFLQKLLGKDVPIVCLSKKVFEHSSYRENPDGFMAICKTFQKTLRDIALCDTPLLLIAERLEKPGNLGALLRTADATSVDAIILNDPITDLFNPNVIRASGGLAFQVPAVLASSEETIEYLKRNKIVSHATTPGGGEDYCQAQLFSSSAIVLGSEKDGLSDFWIQNCDRKISLPMLGKADSLNVSATASAVLYEAVRQRQKRAGKSFYNSF